jgi:hypothetical protein
MNGMSDKNGSYDGTSGYSNNCVQMERRSIGRTAIYADTAIANTLARER